MPLQSHTLLVTYGTSLFQWFSLMDPFHVNIQIGFHICFVITMLAAECLASLIMGSFNVCLQVRFTNRLETDRTLYCLYDSLIFRNITLGNFIMFCKALDILSTIRTRIHRTMN